VPQGQHAVVLFEQESTKEDLARGKWSRIVVLLLV
jgi:hypothetical protein